MDNTFEDRFKKIINKLEEAGQNYANAKAESWYSQENCSSIKASIMLRAMQSDPKLSAQKAEVIAKASQDYIKHLQETSDKIRKEHLAKVEYDKWDKSFEANRSLSSLEKRIIEKSEGY